MELEGCRIGEDPANVGVLVAKCIHQASLPQPMYKDVAAATGSPATYEDEKIVAFRGHLSSSMSVVSQDTGLRKSQAQPPSNIAIKPIPSTRTVGMHTAS